LSKMYAFGIWMSPKGWIYGLVR